MKKLMILAAVAAIASTGLAANDTRTAEEYRAIANLVLAETNNNARMSIASSNGLWKITWRQDLESTRLEIDDDLAKAGIKVVSRYSKTWPKLSAASREVFGFSTNMPISSVVISKYNSNFFPAELERSGITIPELISCFSEDMKIYISGNGFCNDWVLNEYKKTIQRLAEKAVKRYLRSQGKSFVTKDGVNPCAQYMDQLNTALNAPRLSGLQEWFTEMNVDARFDVSFLPTEEEVAKLKTDILYGERPMNEKNRRKLLVCLGVDGFNAFVKEYNGD